MGLKFFEKLYEALVLVGSWLKSPVMLLIRLYWGWFFFSAGWDKIQHLHAFIQSLDAFGFIKPCFQGYFFSYSELIAGAFLLIGFASRLVALLIAVTALVVYATFPIHELKEAMLGYHEFSGEASMAFILAMLTVVAFGPGRFSIDYILEKALLKKHKDFYHH